MATPAASADRQECVDVCGGAFCMCVCVRNSDMMLPREGRGGSACPRPLGRLPGDSWKSLLELPVSDLFRK